MIAALAYLDEHFDEITVIDFEFQSEGGLHMEGGRRYGGRPLPLCLATKELHSGRVLRLWRNDLYRLCRAPFDTGPRALVVCFFASAEIGCFIALRWPPPFHIVCLHAEYRLRVNGASTDKSPGLLDALAAYNLPRMGAAEKDANREKILTSSDWLEDEKAKTSKYCQSDVEETADLFTTMASQLDFPRCLLRGRYTAAVARMEWNGIPLDTQWWNRFNPVREPLLRKLVKEVDVDGIYDGLTFKMRRFGRMLAYRNIPWARTETGELFTKAEYFRDQAMIYDCIRPLHQLRETLKKLREPKLAIGPDGRNRALLGPWGTITGRNAASTTKSIFGPDRWTRSTILPTFGSSLAYVDWSAQEIGIAAFLSGDERLIETYLSLDPYLYFAELAGLVPAGTVRGSDEVEIIRARCKWLFLGVNYGMSIYGLAHRLGVSPPEASDLLQLHRSRYPTYWRWIERVLDNTDLRSRDWTMFGWSIRVVDNVLDPKKSTKVRTLMNWPAQSHGAEMMRIAAIALTEAGIRVAFPVHDAFLIEAADCDIVETAQYAKEIMGQAGSAMFGQPFKAKIHLFQEKRFEDDRPGSKLMWERVNRLLADSEAEQHTSSTVVSCGWETTLSMVR